MKIEHYVTQSSCDDKEALDYNYMLGVCLGYTEVRQKHKNLTCDSSRGNFELTINPLVKASIDYIKYLDGGTIYFQSNDINKDLKKL